MAKANQQQTLYRFRTLRDPELLNPEKKDLRFVFNYNLEGSYFYNAVIDRPSGTSKWKAMKDASLTFTPFSSPESGSDYAVIGEWLSRNKGTLTAEQIYARVSTMTPIDDPVYLNDFWDNLYCQVILHDNFYVKEMVVQVLILQNLLTNIDGLTKLEAEKIVLGLANAKVVLSEEMFIDSGANPLETAKGFGTAETPNFSTKQLSKSGNIALAQLNIARNNTAILELKKLQANYYASFEKSYNEAISEFLEAVDKAYELATPVEKETTDCSGCKHYYVDYEGLKLPNFNYKGPTEVTDAILEANLSSESYYVVKSLGLEYSNTYQKIIDGVNASTKVNYDEMYDLMPGTSSPITIGGMTFKSTSAPEIDPDTFPSQTDIPFLAYYIPTSFSPKKGRVVVALQMGYPDADATAATFTATFPSGGSNTFTIGNMTDSPLGNSLNLVFFSLNGGIEIPAADSHFDFTATVTLSNGTQFQLTCTLELIGRVSGIAKILKQQSTGGGDDTAAFVPKKFGIRRLGIADYKKVVSEVCCYREAEVSHIENIMQGEFKSKTTTRERIEETTVTTEKSTEVENLTDSTSTERFEMQTEIAKLVQEQKDMNAYVKAQYDSEAYMLEIGGGYASTSSQQESNSQSVTQAKELTERAMERIVTKFREETIRKVTESFKDENSHIFDNRGGTGHVSGVYRFINAIYKNQIYNYGKRLMYEFMVPQPSKLYLYGREKSNTSSDAGNSENEPIAPTDPKTIGLTSSAALNANNYQALASQYEAEIEVMPSEILVAGKAYRGEGGDTARSFEFNDLKIPEGYKADYGNYKISMRHSGHSNLNADLIIGLKHFPLVKQGVHGTGNITNYGVGFDMDNIPYSQESIPVALTGWDLGAFSLTVSITFNRTAEKYQQWQIKTYEAIMRAYRERLREYQDSLSETQSEGQELVATNPLFYRQIEMITLKKNCLSYIVPQTQMGVGYFSGDNFTNYSVTLSQEMDTYASKAKFMEQAFDWDIMSYNFYPYYWGNRNNWLELYQSEDDDPLFRSFIQSGMARVIVSVKPGFEQAVMHYMETGEIWNGGEMPVIGDPLYLSIVDELAEQEYTVEETWETVVPTSLIGLQKDGVAIDVSGLPCGGGCETDEGPDPLKPNTNKLPVPIVAEPSQN